MKILFVTPWVPAPIRPRSFTILRMLAEEHDVQFLSLVRHDAEAELADDLPVAARTLVPNPRVGSMVRSLQALGSGVSLQQGYASPADFTKAFHAKLAEWQPDVVHLNVFRTVHLVEECGRTPVIVDLDEFRSEYYEQLAETGSSLPWRMLGRVEARRMKAREDELVSKRVPIMLSAPPLPGQEMRPNTFVVRSPYDYPGQGRTGPTEPIVLFVGRLTYEANVSGLMWFVRECWDSIRRAVPEARLRIVGSEPSRSVLALAQEGNGIEIYPNAPSVEPHYAASSVAIAPIFRGTGVQMKLIQSLAAGVPTVTTRTVAERAGVVDGTHVAVADDPSGWTAAICRLLDGQGDSERLAANGRQWAVANHGTAAVRQQLATAYAAVLGDTVPDGSL